MTTDETFATSRRNLLRGGALAGGLMLGSGLAAGARANATTTKAGATPAAELTLADYFLKLDGIEGESQDPTHQNWIDIDSYGFQVTNSKASGKAGKVKLGEVHFTKVVDAASPTLYTHCVNGKHIANGYIHVRKSSDKGDYLQYKLSEVFISSVQPAAADQAEPVELISLNYSKIEFDYKSQASLGSAS
jgi:type VI secretion system secreted protein Hcp